MVVLSTILWEHPDSRAFCEVESVKFKRMLKAYGASLNGYIMGYRKVLFVCGAHLSGPHKETLLEPLCSI